MEVAGAVLIADGDQRAVFIQPVEIAAFRELIELILARPTVAGPPLIPGPLAALDAKLAQIASGNATVIGLTAVDEECLTLLRHQIALRERLPLRVQRTCATCGQTKILNPNLITKSKAFENTSSVAGAVLETVGLLAEGHHVRAVIKVMGSVSEIAGKNQEDIPACDDCQGQEFETPAVTYCPSCRKLRAETILLQCPDCAADFVDPDDLPDVWVSPEQAHATFRVTANIALFTALAPKFENRLYGDQRDFLASKLTAADQLIAMCRCSRPGESLRSVALLLTTYQLVWARQLLGGSMTGGAVPWSDVTGIRTFAMAKSVDASIQIESAAGQLTFDGFKNSGVDFGASANTALGIIGSGGTGSGAVGSGDTVSLRPTSLRPTSLGPTSLRPTFGAAGITALMAELAGVDVALPPAPPSNALPPNAPSSAPPSSAPPSSAPPWLVPSSPVPSSPVPSSPTPPPVPVQVAPPAGIAAPLMPPTLMPVPPVSAPPASAPPVSAPPVSAPPASVPELPQPVNALIPFPEPVTWIDQDQHEPAQASGAMPTQLPAMPPYQAPPPSAATPAQPPPPPYQVPQTPQYPGPPASAVQYPVPQHQAQQVQAQQHQATQHQATPIQAPPTHAPAHTTSPVPPTVARYPVTPSFERDPALATPPHQASASQAPPNQAPPNQAPQNPAIQNPAIQSPAPQCPAPHSQAPHSQAPRYPAPHYEPGTPTSGVPTSPAFGPAAVPQIDLSTAPAPAPPALPGWYTDPFNQYRYRWWDGTRWTLTFHR